MHKLWRRALGSGSKKGTTCQIKANERNQCSATRCKKTRDYQRQIVIQIKAFRECVGWVRKSYSRALSPTFTMPRQREQACGERMNNTTGVRICMVFCRLRKRITTSTSSPKQTRTDEDRDSHKQVPRLGRLNNPPPPGHDGQPGLSV